jgi:hypothetical protein
MVRELEVLNRAAGAAVAVGAYSLYCAGVLAMSPDRYVAIPHLAWLFDQIPRWALALGHLILAVALFGSTRKAHRILVAMITSTLVFASWSLLTVLPAALGEVEAGSTMGLGAYAFAAAYSLYWAIQMTRHCRGGEDA